MLYLCAMKRIAYLFLLLLCVAFLQHNVYASHVVGGEITYRKQFGNTYQFQLVVYRNCAECAFNTENCPDIPDLDILGAPGTLQAGQKLGSIDLAKSSIRDITPVCRTVASACTATPGINAGVEAWIYSGTFDFTALMSVQCKLHIAVRIDARTDAWGTAEYFYNYAALDLCNNLSNNSPQLTAPAFYLLAEHEPFRYNLQATDEDGDSLSYHLVAAQKGYERNVLYPSGLKPTQPMEVFCAGITPCPVNPNADPPTGMFLDSLDGDLVFTPLTSGSRGFLVLEVREWRKISGVMTLIGTVRRDLQYLVLSVTNAAPSLKIVGADEWHCAGDESCVEIYGSDPAFLGVQDSMLLQADADFKGFLFKQNTSKRGTADASFCWTPSSAQVRSTPYRITFSVRDQACPLNLRAYSSIRIKVAEKVKAGMVLTLDTCGYLNAAATVSSFHADHVYQWYLLNSKDELLGQETGIRPRFKLPAGGRYKLRLELKNAVTSCMSIAEDSIVLPSFTRPETSIQAPVQSCPGASGTAVLQVSGGSKPFRYLWDGVSGDSLHNFIMPSDPSKSYQKEVQLIDQMGCAVRKRLWVQPFPYEPIGFRDTAICSSAPELALRALCTSSASLNVQLLQGTSTLAGLWPNLRLRHQGNVGVNELLAYYADAFGCMRRDTAQITVTQLPVHGISPLPDICEGQSVLDLRLESGLRLLGGTWFANGRQLSGDTLNTAQLLPGSIDLTYRWQAGGCFIEHQQQFQVKPKPSLTLDAQLPTALCADRAKTLELKAFPQGGYWYGSAVQGNLLHVPAMATTLLAVYHFEDPLSHCADTLHYPLATVLPPKFTRLEGYETSICAGEFLDISVQSNHGNRFSFFSNQEDALSHTAGTHTRFSPLPSGGIVALRITAESENVCPNADTILPVRVKPMPVLHAQVLAMRGCAPFETDIRLDAPDQVFPDLYRWITAAEIQPLGAHQYRIRFAESGVYPLSIYLEREGCAQTLLLADSIRVHATPRADFDVLPGTVVDWEYPTVTLQANVACPDSLKYFWTIQGMGQWTQRGERPVVNFPAPGNYDILLRAVSEYGCVGEARREVRVNPPLHYFVPNAFTPDGRMPEENNTFKVSIAEEVADFQLSVYDRWGQKVFQSDLPETGWDGRNPDGTALPVGAYAWSLKFRTASGRAVASNGLVILLR